MMLLLLVMIVVSDGGGGGGGVRRRWGRLGEEAAEVVALDDLDHVPRLNVPDFDEGGLEGEHIRVLEC